MRAENVIENKTEYARDSRAWIAASCMPGLGLITGCFREAMLSYHFDQKIEIREYRTLIHAQRICWTKADHHRAGFIQNLLSIVILATLIGTGIINATSLNIGLVSGGCGLFLMLAFRNIYQILQCNIKASEAGHRASSILFNLPLDNRFK